MVARRGSRSRDLAMVVLLLSFGGFVGCGGPPAPRDVDPPPRVEPDRPSATPDRAPPGSGEKTPRGTTPTEDRGPSSNSGSMSAEDLLNELASDTASQRANEARKREQQARALDEMLDPNKPRTTTPDNPPPVIPREVRPKTDSPLATSANDALSAERYTDLVTGATLVNALPSDGGDLQLQRTHSDQRRARLFGEAASVAEAEYSQGRSGRIRAQICDLGPQSAELTKRALRWQTEARKSTGPIMDLAFERARMIDDRPALVRYDANEATGSIELVARGRFHLYVTGTTVHLETLEKVLGAIDLEAVFAAAEK